MAKKYYGMSRKYSRNTDQFINGLNMIFLLQVVKTIQPTIDGIEFGRIEIYSFELV